MQAVGLITEYNPFHNGHLYHLHKAKQITGADVVVAAMSGNFTQRGEPTILDKWQRAESALTNGVDLVVELPIAAAVQPAHLFAQGGLQILHSLGVRNVVFGAEHPSLNFDRLVAGAQHIDHESFVDYNGTFASNFNAQLVQQTGVSLTDPNDILSFAYFQARQTLGLDDLRLIPIQRINNDYHDDQISGQTDLASANAIRQALFTGTKFTQVVPAMTAQQLSSLPTVVDWPGLYSLFRYRLNTSSVEDLRPIYQMAEGLEYKFKRAAENAPQFDDFLTEVKSKRYTYARLTRLCLYTLLQITTSDIKRYQSHPYLRVLGFTNRGRQYLHEIKKQLDLPLVVRVGHSEKSGLVELDYRAGKVYEQFSHVEQDIRRQPISL